MRDYFYGWYFKCQSQTHTLAMIPAIHRRGNQRSASLQIICDSGSWNLAIPWKNGHVKADRPWCAMGTSLFEPARVHLDVQTENCQISGDLLFGEITPLAYDIMGPFRYVPFLECRHMVYSMEHPVSGKIRLNGEVLDFSQGKGYLEGDRGHSFPRGYAWTQCFFPGGSLMLAAAEIPLGPGHFWGVIGVVYLEGKEYRLATYLGAKLRKLRDGEILVTQGKLELWAKRLGGEGSPLQAPVQGAMKRVIREQVACEARYVLKEQGRVLLEFTSNQASFEFESINGGKAGRV